LTLTRDNRARLTITSNWLCCINRQFVD